MKVGIVPSDVPPCLLYRSRGPADTLAKQGEIEMKMLTDGLRVRYARRGNGDLEPVGIKNLDQIDVDVLVLVRGVFPERIHQIIPLLQREGIAVVVDYDDDYEALPAELHSLYKINPNLNPYYNWAHAKAAAKLADLVTVSTPALQARYPGSVLLRNCVPEAYTHMTSKRPSLSVGWGGTIAGHPGDLRVPGSGVAEACRDTGARFINVGDGVGVKMDLGLYDPPVVTGIVNLEQYPKEIAKFDVGIAPLVSSRYSNAKSYLKFLESLAVGSAVVASDTPEYIVLRDELGEWCSRNQAPTPGEVATSKRRDWKRKVLSALQRSDEDRRQVAEAARAFVRERHTLEENAWVWAESWEQAIVNLKARKK